ncbi:hypothetical protein DENIS_0464 [Desulfonema ishimotonii]|uniref:B12-binding domain-containing protein n=1 Tax=Desulfonema ishimotonii TaxID=45657 RepID=A0A401FRE1_9BACT|nr:cobalamin-dependent protein [Desulfonema ishimotonii]GBC59525.1 hypothetical protein DENIS_0464 [Desulfonema ishimotonii]
MDSPETQLRRRISETLNTLKAAGRPSRTAFSDEATALIRWRHARNIGGIWKNPPLMITATLDDGWGHGLEIIHLYAEAAGLRLLPLGLLQTPEHIIAGCRKHAPKILGLTILQFDTEDALAYIRNSIPPETQIVAGGPLFRADPELAGRTGIDFVAKDAGAFMGYLMTL